MRPDFIFSESQEEEEEDAFDFSYLYSTRALLPPARSRSRQLSTAKHGKITESRVC